MFSPEHKERISGVIFPNISKSFFNCCYKEVRRKVMRSLHIRVVWTERSNENRELVAGFEQIVSDKSETMLKSRSLAVYAMYAILFHVLLRESKLLK